MAFADFPAQFPDGHDLTSARRRLRDEIEHPRQRPYAESPRQPQLEQQVLTERCLGVHGHRPKPGGDLSFFEGCRSGLETGRQVAFGVQLAYQRPLTLARRQKPEPGSDRRFADSALAGDEQELVVE